MIMLNVNTRRSYVKGIQTLSILSFYFLLFFEIKYFLTSNIVSFTSIVVVNLLS